MVYLIALDIRELWEECEYEYLTIEGHSSDDIRDACLYYDAHYVFEICESIKHWDDGPEVQRAVIYQVDFVDGPQLGKYISEREI